MRVEIVDVMDGEASIPAFPPAEDFIDLRENPHAIEQISSVRASLPLRNFLCAVNSAGSVFASASAATECKPISGGSAREDFEFASRMRLVFAVPSLNIDRRQYTDLAAGLKELLERDSNDSVRGVLEIVPCDFLEQNRRGFCLEVQLVARGDSAKQAELRWGLGLARVQQALLFRARALGQQIGARDSDDLLPSGNK